MPIHRSAILVTATMLAACGGGSGDGSAPPVPMPAPAPSKLNLAPNHSPGAARLSMGVTGSAYGYARLGVGIVDRWLDVPITFSPVIPCPGGGSMTIELTDRNADRSLDPLDTV